MQRRGVEAYDSQEQVREEPLGLAQEGAFGLNTSKLLEKARVMTSESESSLRVS
jgi:hypothetical protein